MPETLTFTTSSVEFGGDDILISRSVQDECKVFIQISEGAGRTAAAFLTIDEALALNDQLVALILDAVQA